MRQINGLKFDPIYKDDFYSIFNHNKKKESKIESSSRGGGVSLTEGGCVLLHGWLTGVTLIYIQVKESMQGARQC